MLIKEITTNGTATNAALLTPTSGKRLEIIRIIGTNKDRADMAVSRGDGSATTRLISIEDSKGFVLEFGDGSGSSGQRLSLNEDEILKWTGGKIATDTILTVHYVERG